MQLGSRVSMMPPASTNARAGGTREETSRASGGGLRARIPALASRCHLLSRRSMRRIFEYPLSSGKKRADAALMLRSSGGTSGGGLGSGSGAVDGGAARCSKGKSVRASVGSSGALLRMACGTSSAGGRRMAARQFTKHSCWCGE